MELFLEHFKGEDVPRHIYHQSSLKHNSQSISNSTLQQITLSEYFNIQVQRNVNPISCFFLIIFFLKVPIKI